MRLLSLIVSTFLALALTACSNFSGAGAANLASQSTPTPTPTPAPMLNSQQLDVTASALTSLVSQLLVSLQNINSIKLNLADQILSSNNSVACPVGGTMAVVAQADLSLSVSSYVYGTISQIGTGSITFSNCQISGGITINGTVAMADISGALALQYNSSTNGGYLVQGTDQLSGNLTLSAGSITETCALNIANTISYSGSLNILSNGSLFSSSNTGQADFEGSFCGDDVSQQTNLAF